MSDSLFQNANTQSVQAIRNAKTRAQGESVQQHDWLPFQLIIRESVGHDHAN